MLRDARERFESCDFPRTDSVQREALLLENYFPTQFLSLLKLRAAAENFIDGSENAFVG